METQTLLSIYFLQNPRIGIGIKIVAAKHKIYLNKLERMIFKCRPENPDGSKKKSIDCLDLRRGQVGLESPRNQILQE